MITIITFTTFYKAFTIITFTPFYKAIRTLYVLLFTPNLFCINKYQIEHYVN